MSDMDVFLNAMEQHADSMDNLRLYKAFKASELLSLIAVMSGEEISFASLRAYLSQPS